MFYNDVGTRFCEHVGVSVQNRLTAKSAFCLLHFLHHAATGLCFDYLHNRLDSFRPDNCEMDPRVAAVIKRPAFRLRAKCLQFTVHDEPSLLAAVKVVNQVVEFSEVSLEVSVGEMQLGVLHNPVLANWPLELYVGWDEWADEVDRLVTVSFSPHNFHRLN